MAFPFVYVFWTSDTYQAICRTEANNTKKNEMDVVREAKDEYWEGKEVDTFVGRRDKAITYNSKLLKSDGSELCAISLDRFKEKGTMTIGDVEYELKHHTGSGKWELVHDDKMACAARKPKAFRTMLILDEYGDDGAVKRKLRMQTRHKGRQNCDFYEVPVSSTDDAAMDADGTRYMSITSTILKLDWDVRKLKDDISDVFMAFNFFIFVILYRRRSRESGGKYLFSLRPFFCTNFRVWWILQPGVLRAVLRQFSRLPASIELFPSAMWWSGDVELVSRSSRVTYRKSSILRTKRLFVTKSQYLIVAGRL